MGSLTPNARFLKENLTAGEFLGLVFPIMSQNKNLQAIMVNIGKFKKKKDLKILW